MRGSGVQRDRLATLGQILEKSGNVAQALRLYVDSHSAKDALRVLTAHGVDLLDTGFADELESLIAASLGNAFEKSPVVTGLRGLLDLVRGRFDEGDRKIARSAGQSNRLELRGAVVLAVRGAPAQLERTPMDLLGRCSRADVARPDPGRGEALLASGMPDRGYGRGARDSSLPPKLKVALVRERDGSRASLLSHWRRARLRRRDRKRASSGCPRPPNSDRAIGVVEHRVASFQISHSSHSLAKDSAQSLWFAQQAATAATRAGDYVDLQYALVLMLSLETRRGNADALSQIEKQLAELGLATRWLRALLASSQAHRHAWVGRLCRCAPSLRKHHRSSSYIPDRAIVRASYALALALDGRPRKAAPWSRRP